MMGIPRKLVPSAVVRNAIRRVVRESHRELARSGAGPALAGLSILVRLAKLPRDPAAPAVDAAGRPRRAFACRPTDRALKRLLRAEIDGLLRRAVAPRAAR